MDFSLILFLLSVFTGVMYVLDCMYWKKSRKDEADAAVREFDQANREAVNRAEKAVMKERKALYKRMSAMPWWLDYTAGLFWVILFVFLFRSFLYEPFRIPSGSMLPTLHIGDFILVNKFDYGVRIPVINTKVIEIGSPKRGDVVVFRYPMDTSVDYIKRVIGVPGDTVEYFNKELTVNGKKLTYTQGSDWVAPDTHFTLTKREETIDSVTHMMAVDDRRPSGLLTAPYSRAEGVCRYNPNGFVCKVPEESYFVMGDNRDNSEDSRYWGVVPDSYLVGRAFFIWANFGELTRFGGFR